MGVRGGGERKARCPLDLEWVMKTKHKLGSFKRLHLHNNDASDDNKNKEILITPERLTVLLVAAGQSHSRET